MFLINYGILEEERNRILKLNNIMEFEADGDTIMGQIELIVNETKDGFVDEDIPYDGEFLIIWFKRLNDALINLKTSQFVTIEVADSDNIWLEFKLNNEEVLISQIKSEKEKCVTEFVVNLPKKRSGFYWSESISKNELINTILNTTSNFMKDLLEMNQLLAESKEFKRLEDKYMKAKELY